MAWFTYDNGTDSSAAKSPTRRKSPLPITGTSDSSPDLQTIQPIPLATSRTTAST
jgi:hypothetical protein